MGVSEWGSEACKHEPKYQLQAIGMADFEWCVLNATLVIIVSQEHG